MGKGRNVLPLRPSRPELILALASAAFVAMPVLVEITGLVAGVIVMLTGHFLLPGRVAVPVLVEVAGLVSRMVVVLTWLLVRHLCSYLVKSRAAHQTGGLRAPLSSALAGLDRCLAFAETEGSTSSSG